MSRRSRKESARGRGSHQLRSHRPGGLSPGPCLPEAAEPSANEQEIARLLEVLQEKYGDDLAAKMADPLWTEVIALSNNATQQARAQTAGHWVAGKNGATPGWTTDAGQT